MYGELRWAQFRINSSTNENNEKTSQYVFICHFLEIILSLVISKISDMWLS